MTKEETLTYLKAYLDGDTAIGNIIPLRSVLESALEYLEPSLPSDLDEAAEEALDEDFGANWYIDERDDGCAEPGYNQKQMLLMFKAGAEWMAGQGCSFETIMQEDDVDELVPTCPDMYNHGYSCGDKVIVQIRNKQLPGEA